MAMPPVSASVLSSANTRRRALQVTADQGGELCMIGPTWSSCSTYVPFYQTVGKGYLAILNTRLETVATFSDGHEQYSV